MIYTSDPREVPAVRLTYTFEDVRDAFWLGYKAVFGRAPTNKCLAVLLAHSAFETGHWEAGLWCNNFGNKKASLNYPGKHCYFKCDEYLEENGKRVRKVFMPPHPQTRFRAYGELHEGAQAQIRFLGTASNPEKGNRYQLAWDAAEAGDPYDFVTQLERKRYFTANLAPYRKGVVSITADFLRRLEGYTGPVPADVSGHELTPVDDLSPGLHEDHAAEGTPLLHAMSDRDFELQQYGSLLRPEADTPIEPPPTKSAPTAAPKPKASKGVLVAAGVLAAALAWAAAYFAGVL